MSKLRGFCTALALVVLSAAPALAGIDTYKVVAAHVTAGSAAPVYNQGIPSAGPYDAMRFPTAGGKVTIDTVFPKLATGPSLVPEFEYLTQGTAHAGNVCFNVCYGVVKSGQSRNSLDLSQCALGGTSEAEPAQYINVVSNLAIGINPKDTTGTNCSGTVCNGADLVIQIELLTGGACAGNTTDDIEVKEFRNGYQQ